MKAHAMGAAAVISVTLAMGSANAVGQSADRAVATHLAAAKTAAGQDYQSLYDQLCSVADNPQPTQVFGAGKGKWKGVERILEKPLNMRKRSRV